MVELVIDSDSQKPRQLRRGGRNHCSVAILLCTKDGEAFLDEQLCSYADQTHDNWLLVASDDGSKDATRDILRRFAASAPQRVIVRDGPDRGYAANFLSLAMDPTIDADFFAFSDQDDAWYSDKLERALDWLTTVSSDIPALYCSRVELVDEEGRNIGLSRLLSRPPTFRNALIESINGNTMVFNRAAKRLLASAGQRRVIGHDWWTYQLITGAGGKIHFDPQPRVKYRQHRSNAIGSNLGWGARRQHLSKVWRGHIGTLYAANLAALRSVPAELIRPENRRVIELFAKARCAFAFARLYFLWKSGVYRQTFLSNVDLVFATLFKRI